ncbi:MAG TPA: hypothetical protein VJP85_05400 [Candidatus Baltobacteraceae bacterium]|nr:hypothetical protein [Candidatus Baltobacteraceae bacterium]
MALSHIVMHFALCNSAARLGPQADLPVHIVVTDKINRDVVDQTARVSRYEGNTSAAEFDVAWGIYRATVTMRAGHATCSAVQYFAVQPDHNRTLTVQLRDGNSPAPVPTLITGTAPFAFSYVEPTVLVFTAGSTKCNGPVGNPVDVNIDQETDNDGYYASVFPSPALAAKGPFVLAVRLKDSQGGYHYIRVPAEFLGMSPRWPSMGQFDVTEDVVDYVQDKPEDTLLCPRLYKTSVH